MRRTVPSRWLALVAAFLLPLLCGGCLDYDEVVTLHADGSGRVRAEFALDVGLLRRLSAALGEELEPGDLADPTRDEVQAMLAVEGVSVTELAVEPDGARTRFRIELEFADLEALHRIEGFSARRRLELFDHGDGQVLLVSRFDPREVVPLPGFGQEGADGSQLEPAQAAAVEALVNELRQGLRLRSELRLPGPLAVSNGEQAADQSPEVSVWSASGATHPQLGQGEVFMRVLCERSALPGVDRLPPAPVDAGRVDDDPFTAPVAARTAAPATAAPEAAAGRHGSGCSLSPASSAPLGGVLLWALLALGIVGLRATSLGRSFSLAC